MLRKKIFEKFKVRQADKSFADDSHYQSGLELARQGRHAEAVAELKYALQTGDGLAETYLALGLAYDHMNRSQESIQAFSEAVKIKPDFTEAYTRLGVAFDRAGQFLKAIRMHLNAIRLEPADVELRKNLGLAYFNVGSYDEAIKAFTQALQINPDDVSVRHCLGLVYLDLEDQVSALQQQKLIKELGHFELAASLSDEIDRQFLRSAGGIASKRQESPDSRADERTIGKY